MYGDGMVEPARPHLRVIPGDPPDDDQVPRKLRFLAEHPDWVIVLDGFWRARRADAETWAVTRYELRVLLDELDRITGNGTAPA